MTIARATGSAPPYFEDLRVGLHERSAPAVTLTDGIAALHQAIVGDRLRLALDATLAREVLGSSIALAHPALVWDVAIGQSTLLTGRVVANLFYRGLVLQRAPAIGDTLSTSTEVVALRQTTPRDGRPATGLAVLRVRTHDQEARAVLDFWRCAMLPLRDPAVRTGHDDSFDDIPAELDRAALRRPFADWRLEALARARELGAAVQSRDDADRPGNAADGPGDDGARPGDAADGLGDAGDGPSDGGASLMAIAPGARWRLHGGDVVSSAPELARLTLNVAAVHHDRDAHRDGRRLVYGGHTIGIAAAQATRALPEIATFVGWHSCDHLAPVHEGDTLRSELELERCEPLPGGGALVHLRSRVRAWGVDGDAGEDSIGRDVLDWRFVALAV